MLGLSHHSYGKGKNNLSRKIAVYPKGLFPAEEEKERVRLEKEKERIKDKFKEYDFIGASEEPKTFREMVIREVYLEQKGRLGKEGTVEETMKARVEVIKRRIKEYEEELQNKIEKGVEEVKMDIEDD
mmetsp:Transcript_5249/g.3967  ORF Transcript_5249/g.3967 Transcript_5249/m.3967 type:complete len:128 (+) Transcript_5249:230-613(+)